MLGNGSGLACRSNRGQTTVAQTSEIALCHLARYSPLF